MSSTKDSHESKVTRRLDGTSLLAIELKILSLSLAIILLPLPLKSISPSSVTKPVADEISITSIDQDWDLLKNVWNKAVEWLHPVTSEQKVAVDIKVARVVGVDLDTEGLHHNLLVEVLGDPAESGVAEVGVVLALAADVIDVLAGTLVWAHHGVVAVDGGWDAGPHGLALVAGLDQRLAAWESFVHTIASVLVKNSWVAALTAGHWAVVLVLGKAISETVTDEDGLQVDVALLVRQDLRGENWDVMTGIRLSSNMKVLLSILWELLEEESEKSVDILASSNSVADRAATVRIADINWLVEEDNRCIVVPGVWIVVDLELLVEGCWTELKEETGQGRAAWATVEPEDDWVVLWIIARLEEPYE